MGEPVSMDSIVLRSGVQNEDLVFNPAPGANDLQFECIEYLVVTTPALSITTNLPTAFNMSCHFKLNYTYTFPYSNTFIAALDADRSFDYEFGRSSMLDESFS